MNQETLSENWEGFLTQENIEDVVERLRYRLTGKQYTFVSCYEYRGWEPRVRVHQKLKPSTGGGDPFGIWHEKDFSHFNVCDSYGVWGLNTASKPHISFDWNQITIRATNGYNQPFYWVIAVE